MKKFTIRGKQASQIRENTINYLYDLPISDEQGWNVSITPYRKNKNAEQEALYHALIDQIRASRQFNFMGRADWTKEDIKRLLVDAFARIKKAEGEPLQNEQRMVPSLDGTGIVAMTTSSRLFTHSEASEFIDYLYAYGTEIGVKWRAIPGQDY